MTSAMVRAQNDLYMVINNNGAEINAMPGDSVEALENGKLTVGELQRSAKNICKFIVNALVMKRPLKPLEEVKAFAPLQDMEGTMAESASDAARQIHTGVWQNRTDLCERGRYLSCSGKPDVQTAGSCAGRFEYQHQRGTALHGTDRWNLGRYMTQKLTRVALKKGWYDVTTEVVKPELEFGWMELRK